MNILHFLIIATSSTISLLAFAGEQMGATTQKRESLDKLCYDALKNYSESNVRSGKAAEGAGAVDWIFPQEEARIAAKSGLDAKAAALFFASYCINRQTSSDIAERLEIGGLTIESLLEAKNIEVAADIFADLNDFRIKSDLPKFSSALLHFRMAESRLLSYQDRNTEALHLREEITAPIDSTFGEQSQESIINRIRIDNLKVELGRIDEATSDLSDLRMKIAHNTNADTQLRLLLARAVASAFGLAGREPEALIELQATRKELVKEVGEDDSRVIRLDQSIGEILTRIDPSEEALEVSSKVFLWRDKHLPPGDMLTLRSLWQLAYLYSENARIDNSRSILRLLSSTIDKNPNAIPRYFQLQVESLVAEVDFKQGRYESALDGAGKVYRGSLEIFGNTAVDTQTAEATYALALQKTGQIDLGCKLLEDVQHEAEQERPEDTWVLEFARIEYERCQIRKETKFGVEAGLNAMAESWAIIRQHNKQESRDALNALASYAFALLENERRAAAIQLLDQYVSLSEKSRRDAASGSTARLAALSEMIFEAAPDISPIACYRELALLHAQDDELERALRISELARDRTLSDRFAEQEWLTDRVPPTVREQLQPLLDEIQSLDERLAVVRDLMERVRLESQRTIAVAKRGRMERELRDQLHLDRPEATPPSLDTLREHLGAGVALVSVMHSGDVWWALVIKRDAAAQFVPLADGSLGRNAAAWVRRLRGEPVRAWPMPNGGLAIDDLRPNGATGPFLTTAQLAQRLGIALLKPLEGAVGNARHIVFVGDDELVGVPLQALPLGSGLAVDRYDISYAPSLTTYARWQSRPATARARDLLAIGAVAYPHRAAMLGDDAVAIGLDYAADHPLPQTASEIAAIGRLFAPGRRRLLTGRAGSKAELRAQSLSGELARYRYVHVATHAWADAERPEASAVVLASDGTEPPLQVVLTAAELAGLRMNADLIVLSACDTGSGSFEHGRGLLGLAYAALAAGNRAAVLSMWSIADADTAPFMTRFYEHMALGLGPVAALAATQREFRHSPDPRRSDPAVWAPFLLYGGY